MGESKPDGLSGIDDVPWIEVAVADGKKTRKREAE